MEVLLVAAKKEKIGDYTGVIAQAGRTPVIVDVDAFALQNAFEVNYGFDPEQVVVLLNAGASAININILQGGQSVFARDVSMGGNTYTEAVQKELDLPFAAAEQLKKGIPVDGATFEEAQPVLRAVTENVLLEIQKTFDFFKATAASDHIDRIVLSGGASRVDGFREMLEERFSTPVEEFDPVPRRDLGSSQARCAVGRSRGDCGGGRRPGAPKGGRPMIRINLLGVERPKARKLPTFTIQAKQLTVACSLILVASLAGVGWWYWSLTQGAAQVETDITTAQQELQRLQSVLAEVRQFEVAAHAAPAAGAADRTASGGADDSGAVTGSRQPKHARDAVAHGHGAEG